LPIAHSLQELQPASIDEKFLESVHQREYLEHVKLVIRQAPARLDMGDTYVTQASWQAALGSAAAALTAADYGLGESQIGFSISRPPGHHATRQNALGFCLLNNVALAARHLQREHIERILIVDFDVHHGNGTQDIFEDDASVYYLSLHQRGIFPGTGHLQERGKGPGEGTVQNVPLPAFSGDEGFLSLLEKLMLKIGREFQPEAIIVSAGYDAHWRDPLANLQLSCHAYHTIGRLLRDHSEEHCEGRLALVLEGGYQPEALYHSTVHTIYGLLRLAAPPDPLGKAKRPEADLGSLLEQVLHP
jgi:acetoin utilization deacetylase AcuC-like enzyme